MSITISASAIIIGIILTAGVAAIFPNPIIGFTFISTVIVLIATFLGLLAAVAIAHCADETAITSVASSTSITESTYVGISQEEEVDECITSITVERAFSAKETAI